MANNLNASRMPTDQEQLFNLLQAKQANAAEEMPTQPPVQQAPDAALSQDLDPMVGMAEPQAQYGQLPLSPDQLRLKKQLEAALSDQISNQKEQVANQKDLLLAQVQNEQPQTNLKPFMNLVDVLSNKPTGQAKNYDVPVTGEERNKSLQGDYQNLMKNQQSITSDQQQQLKNLLADQKYGMVKPSDAARQDTRDQLIHQRIIGRVTNDKPTLQRLTQYSNLSNALSNFANADIRTPEQFDELQQAIRANLGIKGTGGVAERANTYYNPMGLKADRLEQILFSKPTDVGHLKEFVSHVRNLANLELKNVDSQVQKRLAATGAGNDTFYQRRKDLKQDFDKVVKATASQFTSPGAQADQAPGAPAPQGGALTAAEQAELAALKAKHGR